MKFLMVVLATVTFTFGFIVFWLPVPLGIPLMIISLPVLMKSSSRIRNSLMLLGRLHPRLAKMLAWLDKRKR